MNKQIIVLLLALFALPLVSAGVDITNVQFDGQDVMGHATARLSFTLENTGTDNEQGLVELAFIDDNGLSFLISGTLTCDTSHWYNVHRTYQIAPGASIDLSIVAENIPPGDYTAVLTHASNCCTNGVQTYDCSELQPFGFKHEIGSITVTAQTGDDQCDTDGDALDYLRSQGDQSCAFADCVNPFSESSTAVCIIDGECNYGAKQTQVCSDGSQVLIRECSVLREWVHTGDTCAGEALPPPPPKDDSNLFAWLIIGGFVAILLFGLVLVWRGLK